MTATSKVDAIQAAVHKAAKAAMAKYEKSNNKNKPTPEFVEKVIRSRLSSKDLVEAFVADAMEGLGH